MKIVLLIIVGLMMLGCQDVRNDEDYTIIIAVDVGDIPAQNTLSEWLQSGVIKLESSDKGLINYSCKKIDYNHLALNLIHKYLRDKQKCYINTDENNMILWIENGAAKLMYEPEITIIN